MSVQFAVGYKSWGWLIQADLYKNGELHPFRRLGTVQKEMRLNTETGEFAGWQPATIDVSINGQSMTRDDLKFLRDTLNKLERIANELDANPAIPADNVEADILTDGVSSASL